MSSSAKKNTQPDQQPDGQLRLDPLYTIFEKHLYDFDEEEDSEVKFIDKIAQDYLNFLADNKVAVPSRWKGLMVTELHDQIRKMMIKKMYGCLSISEYVLNQPDVKTKKKNATRKYRKLY